MARTLIYSKSNALYVVSEIKTDRLWRIASLPVFVVDPRDDAARLGSTVVTSLQHYREGVPHPEDVSDENDPVLRALDLKTWDELSSITTKLCYVEQEGAAVTVTPTLGDENGGYTPERTHAKTVRLDATEIGESVMAMLSAPQGT